MTQLQFNARPGSRRPDSGAAKNKVNRADQAQGGPQVVQFERLTHVEQREGHEHGQRHHLLQDLELRQAQARLLEPDAVGGDLQQVFNLETAVDALEIP